MQNGLSKFLSIVIMVCIISGPVYAETGSDVPDVGLLDVGGFKFKGSLTHYWQGAVGGIERKNADRFSGLYDLDFYYLLDAQDDDNNQGDYMILAISSQMTFGHGVDGKVQSLFDLNDGSKGDNDLFLDKFFVEFTAWDRQLTFNVGKIDMIDYFDHSAVANEYKTQFLAYPFVNNPAVPFPSKGLGIRAIYEPDSFWFVQAAVADGQADKRETGFNTTFHDEDYLFSILELGIRPRFFDMDGTYRFMTWYEPEDKSYLNGQSKTKQDDLGFAVSFDQEVMEDTTLFFRYGWADEKVNEIEDFVSFGGQVKGLFEGRDDDILAVGYANALRSAEGLSAGQEHHIDLIETYYRYQIDKNSHISPVLQFVMDPGNLKKESPATVFGLRYRVTF